MNKIHQELATLFNKHGFRLYMVGGSSRDYLLNIPFDDYDFTTNATPDDMKEFLPDADFTFAQYGGVSLKLDGYKIEITTLREEGEYLDSRHPSFIKFVDSLEIDHKRRDLTINAIYIDEKGKVIDFENGLEDLKNKTIRLIGNPKKRIEEDPLRIIRIKRFANKLGFTLEEKTKKAIEEGEPLLAKLNPEKIKLEMMKEGK